MSTLATMLHPHHVSLIKNQFSVQSLMHSFADRVDPYYEYDGRASQRGISSPRFNISETENEFLLDGELPGLADKKQIIVEWLQNQVLIIRGVIQPGDTETMVDPFQKGGLQNEYPNAKKHEDQKKNEERLELDAEVDAPKFAGGPKPVLRERHLGEFQRSFTFPTEVDSDHMKASLANGLLRIVVPKKAGAVKETKRINVQ